MGDKKRLEEIIIDRIRKEGPISFHDFMDMCLYYPEQGYYTSPGEKIGMNGDFYTSPVFTSLFGKLIAKQIEEMWKVLGKPHFTIVEYGAGTGQLCYDILQSLEKNKSLYMDLRYCIIEKSLYMRFKQKEKLPGKVSWHEHINEIRGFTGCVLSNEVVDNFPVHLVVMQHELMEVMVDYKNKFVEQLRPADAELKDYLDESKISLPSAYRTEINLEIKEWIQDIAKAMSRGYVLTIDYGYPVHEFYSPRRKEGTLMCFHKQQIIHDPFRNIGMQDITAHVDFSAIKNYGEKAGLQFAGFTDQASFLQGLGLAEGIRKLEKAENLNPIRKLEILRMVNTFLLDMGKKFKVLLLQKKTPPKPLPGFQFSNSLI